MANCYVILGVMDVAKIIVGPLEVNCYVISEPGTAKAVVIDPGDEPEKIIAFVESKGLKPEYILFTHAHYDHVCAARELHDQYGAVIVMHEDELQTYRMTARFCTSMGYEPVDFPEPEKTVKEGEILAAGRLRFKIIHTPGHTPGSVCISAKNVLFTGDTLFKGAAGRTDLAGGDFALLLGSLKRLMLLPGATKVLCGHNGETSIEEEVRNNPFIKYL
jgi:hydroxyacylglutathione hydrolase